MPDTTVIGVGVALAAATALVVWAAASSACRRRAVACVRASGGAFVWQQLVWLPCLECRRAWGRRALRAALRGAYLHARLGPFGALVAAGPVPAPRGTTRFVCVSDTHLAHRDVDVPPGDVLLHAGDILVRPCLRARACTAAAQSIRARARRVGATVAAPARRAGAGPLGQRCGARGLCGLARGPTSRVEGGDWFVGVAWRGAAWEAAHALAQEVTMTGCWRSWGPRRCSERSGRLWCTCASVSAAMARRARSRRAL